MVGSTTRLEQMVSMMGALLDVGGARASQAVDRLVDSLSSDMLADVVISGMEFLPASANAKAGGEQEGERGMEAGGGKAVAEAAPAAAAPAPGAVMKEGVPPAAAVTAPAGVGAGGAAAAAARRDPRRVSGAVSLYAFAWCMDSPSRPLVWWTVCWISQWLLAHCLFLIGDPCRLAIQLSSLFSVLPSIVSLAS